MPTIDVTAEMYRQRIEELQALLDKARSERDAMHRQLLDVMAMRTAESAEHEREMQREHEMTQRLVKGRDHFAQDAKDFERLAVQLADAINRTAERFGMPVDYEGASLSYLSERITAERDTRAHLGQSLLVLRRRAQEVLDEKDVLGRQLKANALLSAVRAVTKFAEPYASTEFVTLALAAEAKAAAKEVAE